MNNWSIKSLDSMKIQQDTATSPPTSSYIDQVVSMAKDCGATHITCDVPYDLPNGGGDVIAQTKMWVDVARKYKLNVWHRHSWCSDQGWYGVAQDFNNDRLQDTKNWILAHPGFFASGDIFCPKPEPQNCGVIGMNSGGPARFQSVAAFNQWIRDSMVNANAAFTQLGIIGIKVGYWGFDGFVVCGYNNPDWQGKSFLEPATVQACGNVLAVDHYPELVGKPMTDFLSVFKQTLPGVKYVAGEWGAVGSGDPVTQIQTTMGTLDADPIVEGINYWVESDNGSQALLGNNLAITPSFTAVQAFFQGSSTPTPPTPIPPIPPTPIPPLPGEYTGEYFDNQTLTGVPKLTRTDKAVNFDWKLGSPDPLIPVDHFSARWTTTDTFVDGQYEFDITVDDGGRLFIDNVNVIDQWHDQGATTYKTTQTITKGDHTIRFEYYENGGNAVAKLSYKLVAATPPTPIPPTPTPPADTIINIAGTVTITTDSTGKISLKINATG